MQKRRNIIPQVGTSMMESNTRNESETRILGVSNIATNAIDNARYKKRTDADELRDLKLKFRTMQHQLTMLKQYIDVLQGKTPGNTKSTRRRLCEFKQGFNVIGRDQQLRHVVKVNKGARKIKCSDDYVYAFKEIRYVLFRDKDRLFNPVKLRFHRSQCCVKILDLLFIKNLKMSAKQVLYGYIESDSSLRVEHKITNTVPPLPSLPVNKIAVVVPSGEGKSTLVTKYPDVFIDAEKVIRELGKDPKYTDMDVMWQEVQEHIDKFHSDKLYLTNLRRFTNRQIVSQILLPQPGNRQNHNNRDMISGPIYYMSHEVKASYLISLHEHTRNLPIHNFKKVNDLKKTIDSYFRNTTIYYKLLRQEQFNEQDQLVISTFCKGVNIDEVTLFEHFIVLYGLSWNYKVSYLGQIPRWIHSKIPRQRVEKIVEIMMSTCPLDINLGLSSDELDLNDIVDYGKMIHSVLMERASTVGAQIIEKNGLKPLLEDLRQELVLIVDDAYNSDVDILKANSYLQCKLLQLSQRVYGPQYKQFKYQSESVLTLIRNTLLD